MWEYGGESQTKVGWRVAPQRSDRSEGSYRREKELSLRATAPRGINESNKFRGLLKLKFDLRPTGDYCRAKLSLSRRLAPADK